MLCGSGHYLGLGRRPTRNPEGCSTVLGLGPNLTPMALFPLLSLPSRSLSLSLSRSLSLSLFLSLSLSLFFSLSLSLSSHLFHLFYLESV